MLIYDYTVKNSNGEDVSILCYNVAKICKTWYN